LQWVNTRDTDTENNVTQAYTHTELLHKGLAALTAGQKAYKQQQPQPVAAAAAVATMALTSSISVRHSSRNTCGRSYTH
jgi:hypothetical protein